MSVCLLNDASTNEAIFYLEYILLMGWRGVMSNKYFNILASIILLLIIIPIEYPSYKYINSYMVMAKEITFSASIFIAFLSIPLLIYALLSGLIYLVSGWRFKYDSLICRCLLIISVISVILSLPISFYVTYKLKQDNYVACDRISWMSPNNFVKPPAVCN
ncbi:DUF1240 domain-containing protein [Yersinia similis]|uniref:Major facilitator superfamily permease n=7 Tax=Yersinia pseudotuberculosis complex TaxID=1649845 RepID=A0A0T9QDG5_9GAMM|nr:DUF1240 domain-containing protein [Yersinia similis]CNB42425.1 major facilitator superfamily permease [Yersinia similis]CNF96253.1 major facilitator superfamily permease [Yersinia similis]CNI06774.1 major facilitator superfamily permease [Yersinia similis]